MKSFLSLSTLTLTVAAALLLNRYEAKTGFASKHVPLALATVLVPFPLPLPLPVPVQMPLPIAPIPAVVFNRSPDAIGSVPVRSVNPIQAAVAAAAARWQAYIDARHAEWNVGKWGEIIGPWRALDVNIRWTDDAMEQFQSALARKPQDPDEISATGKNYLWLVEVFMPPELPSGNK